MPFSPVLQAADAGKPVRVRVTAMLGASSVVATSAAATVQAATSPPADYTVSSAQQLADTLALGGLALSGKTIAVAPGQYGSPTLALPTGNNQPIIIRAANLADRPVFSKLDFIGSGERIIVDGLAFANNNSQGAPFSPSPSYNNYYMLVFQGAVSNIRVTRCTANGQPHSTSRAIADRKQWFGFVRFVNNGAGIEVDNCEARYVRDVVVANGNPASGAVNVHDNFAEWVYEDYCTGTTNDWIFSRNRFTRPIGSYGQGWSRGTTTGTIAVGEVLTNGLSGTSKKLLKVVLYDDRGTTSIGGYFNIFAKPAPGETYYGANGSVQLGAEISSNNNPPGSMDGIHGDVFQPIITGSTRKHTILADDNECYRSDPYDFDSLDGEQASQGLLLQKNASTFNYASITCRGNNLAACFTAGIKIEGADSFTVINNTVSWPEYAGGLRPTISISSSGTGFAYSNLADNSLGGGVKDDGGNANLMQYNNIGMTAAQVTAYLNDPYSYPQTAAKLAPKSTQPPETSATGPAGALNPDGSRRAYSGGPPAMRPLPDAGPTSLSTGSAFSNTLTMAFAAVAGSARRVVVAVGFGSSNNTATTVASCTWGGVALTKLAEVKSSTNQEGVALFEIAEGVFPAGGTGDIVATTNGDAGTSVVIIEACTIPNAPTAAANVTTSVVTTGELAIGPVTPASGGVMLAVYTLGLSSSQNFTEGVNGYGARVNTSGYARTMRMGVGTNLSASPRTVKTAALGARAQGIIATWAPG